MASTRNSHHRACRVSQSSQNGNSEPYEALFQSPGLPDLTLTGSRTSISRKIDPKLRIRAKNLLSAIKDEKYVRDFNESLVERCDVLTRLRAIANFRRGIADVVCAEMKETLADVNIDDLSILLRQVLLSMERYIPRTHQNPGTAQSLKDSHISLVENITSVVSLYWSVSLMLECHQTDDFLINVRACFQNFVGILKFLPFFAQISVMRILKEWSDHFNISVIGPQAAEMLSTELASVCRAAGDFEQQKLIGSLLVHVWNVDPRLVENFACAAGLRNCLPEFCQIFRSTNPSNLSCKIAQFFNQQNGIHRRVFSFPILDVSGSRMSVFGENHHLENPNSNSNLNRNRSEGRKDFSSWFLNFSVSSSLISFEILTRDQHVGVVKIPASAVASVESSIAEKTVLLSFFLENFLENFVAEEFSGCEIPAEIALCDRLCFHLDISKCHELILLEKALEIFFSSRKGDEFFTFDVNLFPQFGFSRELNGRGLDPGVPRKLEGKCYRQALCEVKLLGKTGLYEEIPPQVAPPSNEKSIFHVAPPSNGEIVSQVAPPSNGEIVSQVAPPSGVESNGDESGLVSALDLSAGAIVLDQPPASTNGIFFLVPGPGGKPVLMTLSNVMDIPSTSGNGSVNVNFSESNPASVESGKEMITVDD